MKKGIIYFLKKLWVIKMLHWTYVIQFGKEKVFLGHNEKGMNPTKFLSGKEGRFKEAIDAGLKPQFKKLEQLPIDECDKFVYDKQCLFVEKYGRDSILNENIVDPTPVECSCGRIVKKGYYDSHKEKYCEKMIEVDDILC